MIVCLTKTNLNTTDFQKFDTCVWRLKRHIGSLQENIDKYRLALFFDLIILWYTLT